MDKSRQISFRCTPELRARIEEYQQREQERINERFGETRIEIKFTSSIISLILAGLSSIEQTERN